MNDSSIGIHLINPIVLSNQFPLKHSDFDEQPAALANNSIEWVEDQ